jgi:hypothetical protein
MRVAEPLRNLVGPLELIHEQAGDRLLRLARRGIVGLWIFKLLLDPLWRLADFPHELFHPVGLLALLPANGQAALLSGPGLLALWISLLAALAACLFEKAFRVASLPAAFLLTVYSSLIRGFGPAVHTDIVLLLAVYALSAFAWADYFMPDSATVPRRASYPLVTIVALLCFPYCLVGLNRTIGGGIHVFTGDTMEVWAIDASLRGYYFNTNIGWHVPQWPLAALLLKLGLPGITFFEITAPLCLVWARYRWVFIPVMLSFHLLSLVIMNIFFFDDMFLYLLLVDWSRKFPSLSHQEGSDPGRLR